MLDLQENHELYECSFSQWYKKFEKISIYGRILAIPVDILEYLRDEIIILPKECYNNETTSVIDDNRLEINIDSASATAVRNSNDKNSDDEDDDDELIEPTFPEFSNRITQIIKSLKGHAAFLKTDWHSPKDAYWITAGQTLKVKDITDVYQLLKASSIAKNDLFETNQVTENRQNFLIFKEWHDIHPGTEFRCFVRKRNLIAISPRDWPAFYAHIVEQKHEIRNDILTVFKEKIKKDFPLNDFVFDIIRDEKDHVRIVDFSPFNEKLTESLAFDWNELKDESCFLEEDDPEFRYLPTDCGIGPTKRNTYGIPKDIIDMFSGSRNEEIGTMVDTITQSADRLISENSEFLG